MKKYTEALNQRITKYITEIHTCKTRITELEAEKDKLKKEVSRQKSLLKKCREEKGAGR